MTTTALVLETNNLRGGAADAERIEQSLMRLLHRLREQTRPLAQLDELVITHDGLPAESEGRLSAAAGRAVRCVRVPDGCGYYEAKNRGFDATTAEVVVFGDADCWPEHEWLERLIAPFEQTGGNAAKVVAGRTTYRPDFLGTAASTIDFMYFDSPLGAGCVRNFYANNVAFRRETFAAHRYAVESGIFRGHCQLLAARLFQAGIPIRFVPQARTYHRFPDSVRELIELRLLRGQDAAELAPRMFEAYLPAPLGAVGRTPVAAAWALLGTRFAFSAKALNRQDMPPLEGASRLACLGAIAGISMVDGVGATLRELGVLKGEDGQDAHSLSYHSNVDQFAA